MGHGGHPGLKERKNFTVLDNTPARGNYKYLECKHRRNTYNADPDGVAPPAATLGRPALYLKHLSSCIYYQASASPAAVVSGGRDAGGSKRPALEALSELSDESTQARGTATSKRVARALETNATPTAKTNTQPKPPASRQFSSSERKQLERLLVEFQADNRLADSFIDHDSTKVLLEFICPGVSAVLPGRRALGGRILDTNSARCTRKSREALQAKQQASGGRVNLLSDVWENASKEHLLGCQLTLYGDTLTYDLLPAGDRHDGIAIAEQLEAVMERICNEEDKATKKKRYTLGAVITDNAGQCGRARRILQLRWRRIVFLKCYAHDINNLVKAVLKTTFTIAAEAAAVVNCINASSSKWLVRAKGMMVRTYGYHLCLCSLCVTRWNSMQACFASLLRVRSALEMLAIQSRLDPEFPQQLRVLDKQYFWEELEAAERIIQPLSIASYRLQRDENTLADVVISYRDIYFGFDSDDVRKETLVKAVEDRWADCEQPLFMLGFALHPHFVDEVVKLPSTDISTTGRLCHFAVYYYRRLIDEDVGCLKRDMFRWLRGEFTRARAEEFDNSSSEYWRFVAAEYPDSLLPRLAVVVLSVAVNTATCERLFSELGSIHTAKRNRMTSAKAHKTHIIAKHVRERYKKQGASKPFHSRILKPDHHELRPDALRSREAAQGNSPYFTTPPPRRTEAATLTPPCVDDENDDPGDSAEQSETLTMWREYLDAVYEDDEVREGYIAAGQSPGQGQQDDEVTVQDLDDDEREETIRARAAGLLSDVGGSMNAVLSRPTAESEDEAIPDDVRTPFPPHNDPNFLRSRDWWAFELAKRRWHRSLD